MTAAALRAARRRLRLSQTELAELLGVSQSQLSRWETGERPIPYAEWLAARLLEIERERKPRR